MLCISNEDNASQPNIIHGYCGNAEFYPPPSGNCELNSKVRDHSEFDSRPWQTRWTEFERFVRSYDIDVSNYDEETWNDYVAELGDDVIEYDTAHIEPDCRFESTIPVLCRRCSDRWMIYRRCDLSSSILGLVERRRLIGNPYGATRRNP